MVNARWRPCHPKTGQYRRRACSDAYVDTVNELEGERSLNIASSRGSKPLWRDRWRIGLFFQWKKRALTEVTNPSANLFLTDRARKSPRSNGVPRMEGPGRWPGGN